MKTLFYVVLAQHVSLPGKTSDQVAFMGLTGFDKNELDK